MANVIGGNYSDYWNFCEFVHDNLNKIKYYLNSSEEILVKTKEDAKLYCVICDIKKMIEKFGHINDVEMEYIPPEDIEYILNIYKESGIEMERPPIYYVDKFPEPYSLMDWTAFAPDAEDERMYGIKKGIYFLKSELVPVYSQILLAHEMIHYYLGKEGAEFLGRGLEEGIADFLSLHLVCMKMYGKDTTYAQIENVKLSSSLGNYGKLYYDYFKITYFIYEVYGFSEIINLVRGGRKKIKEAEREIANLEYFEIGAINNEKIDEIGIFIRTFSEYLKLSPLAYFVLKKMGKAPMSFNVLKENLGLDESSMHSVINELQNEVYFILTDGKNRIDYSDCELYRHSKFLKYNI